MFKIRNGCFETNSSSSHAMIVMKENKVLPDMFDTRYYIIDGVLRIWTDDLEFDRSPFEVLSDWYGRLCYTIATFKEDKFDEIESICFKRIYGLKQIELGRTESEFEKYGYIDHQSDGLLKVFLREQNITIEDFIFNDRYIVVIDGDEYNVFDTMVKCGLIDNEKIESTRRVFN